MGRRAFLGWQLGSLRDIRDAGGREVAEVVVAVPVVERSVRVEEVEVRSVGGAVRLGEVEGSVVFGSDGFVVLGREGSVGGRVVDPEDSLEL